MKVLHLLYAGLGGHGNVFFSFIKADENKQIENEAIFAGVEPIRDEYISNCNKANIPWQSLRKRKGVDIGFSKKLLHSLRASISSVIFLHGSRFIILAKIAVLTSSKKKKIVVRETQANHLKTGYDWMRLIASMILADRMVFLTPVFEAEIRKKLSLIYRPNKISIVNNGIDLTFFKPAIKQANKRIILGMQSRIVSIKDHSTLLKAFAILQQDPSQLSLELKIAGEGDLMPALKLLAKELQIDNKVQFTGVLNEDDLLHFLHGIDIYVHASMGETMSTAIMQAMACRLTVIASDVPGINNMIEHNKTGVLIPVKNEAALANAILYIIDNPTKANAMAQAAYSHALLNFSSKTMFAKYVSLFEGSNKINR